MRGHRSTLIPGAEEGRREKGQARKGRRKAKKSGTRPEEALLIPANLSRRLGSGATLCGSARTTCLAS